MISIEEIKIDLKETLSEKRYNHCIAVMEKAEELAKIYNANTEEVMITALAHDIAKEMTIDEMMSYIKKNDIKIDDIEKIQPAILHGPIGADICKKRYGFSENMARSIAIHSTGDINMSKLNKIVYLSDKIEKNRTYDTVEEIREASQKDLDQAVLLFLNHHITNMIRKERIIHPKSISLRNELLLKQNKE